MSRDQRAERMRFQLLCPLRANDCIVIAEDRDGDHRSAGRYWHRRKLHLGGRIYLVHHLRRRQRAV